MATPSLPLLRFWEVCKTFITIELTAFLLLLACLLLSLASQAQTVTLSEKKVSLDKIFHEIKEQTGFDFFYEAQLLKEAKKVDIAVTNATIEEVLKICFRDQELSFSIVEKTIFVKKKVSPAPQPVKEASPLSLKSAIHGRVFDENSNPLAGASVSVKGSAKGVETDEKGNFECKNVRDDDVLEISFTGYHSQEVLVDGRHSFFINLVAVNNPLDQVQVIAYGTTTRRFSTGNITTVKAADIEKQPVSNPLMALQGHTPGVLITTISGVPGADITVQVRGENSFESGFTPLYIIDGVPVASSPISTQVTTASKSVNPLNTINPADIESISILKDADATSIYGSRGANGVLVITTKKGKAGKTRLNADINTGFSQSSRFIDFLPTHQYLQLRRAAFAADGITPTPVNAPDLLLWDTTVNNNWQKIVYGNPDPVTNVQVSLSGGDEHTRFLLGLGYHGEGTVLPGNGFDKRSSLHFNMEHNSPDKRLYLNATVTYGNDRLRVTAADPYSDLNTPPDMPVYDSTGNNPYWLNGANITDNPISDKYAPAKTKTDNFIGSANLRYKLTGNIDLKLDMGYTRQNQPQIITNSSKSLNPYVNYGYSNAATFGYSNTQTYNLEPQLTYAGTLGKGRISGLLGATLQDNTAATQAIVATNFPSDALLESLNAAASIQSDYSTSSEYRYESLFGRLNYNLSSTYILNASFRRDGSSRFGPGRRFGNFWSLAGAWLFTEEKWVKEVLPFISFGKLRASYGTSGNDQIGDYRYLQTYTPTNYPYLGVAGLSPFNVANPYYNWEINKKLELALEVELFKGRIAFSAAVYRHRSGNQLVNYPLASQTGFSGYRANLPALLQNKGLELELVTKNIAGKKFTWTTSFTITLPANKLLKYPGLANSSYSDLYVVGQSLSIVRTLQVTGIDPQTGIPVFNDVNKDGQITNADFVNIGDLAPAYYGGLGNSFSYKGFSLDIFFQFQKQLGYGYLFDFNAPLGFMLNVSSQRAKGYWRGPGDIARYPGLTTTAGSAVYTAYYDNYRYSSASISNASFIRLKNLSFSYSIPQKWLGRSGFENVRIFFEAQNWLTITSFDGLDPEVQGGAPLLKTFVAGIHFTL